MSLSDSEYVTIDKDIRNTGFFSEYLPPCFQLNPKAFLQPPPFECDLIPPYNFNMSRFNQNDARRIISIPEIGAYAVVHAYMKEKHIVKDLIEFTENNPCSFSPILGVNHTIIRHEQSYGGDAPTGDIPMPSDYISNLAAKIIKASGAKKILKLDISNFFSSFYLHMIPAIILGFDEANRQFQNFQHGESVSDTYTIYKNLDSIYRKQNLNRTNGLLVGPLSSKIIAEGMMARIDEELCNAGLNYSRYVDDYEIYIYNDDEKQIVSIVGRILKKYGFTLNYEKTEITEFPYYIAENLKKIIEKYQSAVDENPLISHNAELMNLFNTFFNLEISGTKGSIRYLLKSIETAPIELTDDQDQRLYRAYLFTILTNNARSLTKACSLILKSTTYEPLNEKEKAQISTMLLMNLLEDHDLEVLWLLYILIEAQALVPNDSAINKIIESQNELAQIMLLRKNFLSDAQKQTISEKAHSWILLYELFSNDIISEESLVRKLNLNKNLNMYRKMKDNDVHFCY